MKKARIALNNAIKENYAFFCPQSNLHLDLMSPVGFTDRVTPSIVRGLKGKTLLDLDNMIDVQGECFIEEGKVEEKKAEDTKVEAKEEKPASKKKAASKATKEE